MATAFFSRALLVARMLASTNSYTDDLKIPDASLPLHTYVHPHLFEQKHALPYLARRAARACREYTPTCSKAPESGPLRRISRVISRPPRGPISRHQARATRYVRVHAHPPTLRIRIRGCTYRDTYWRSPTLDSHKHTTAAHQCAWGEGHVRPLGRFDRGQRPYAVRQTGRVES